jgi:DNA-binding response OmpR family regulator
MSTNEFDIRNIRLLLVEDNPADARVVERHLRDAGLNQVTSDWVQTASEAIQRLQTVEYDLVLLDLGLPDLDGVEVCRRLRQAQPGAVIVILTARADEMDVVVGLEAGADDYLTKPVRLTELHARIRAHLRRNAGAPDQMPAVPVGDLVVDRASRRVTVNGHELTLRAKEFDLLARLAAEPEKAVSRETLMSDVWDENWFGSTKTLDVHVAAVRRKLAEVGDAGAVPQIVTLRGHGYRLDVPSAPPSAR